MKPTKRNHILLLAFLLGFTCFITQLVLIREFLALFMGNELVIGIVLALWMLFTALGAWLGKYVKTGRSENEKIFGVLILLAILPLAGAFSANWLKHILYAPGVMSGLGGVFLITAAGLMAFCLFTGLLFTMLATAVTSKKGAISRIYTIEAIGSLVAGLLFNFILIHLLNAMFILSLLMVLILFAAAYYALKIKLWAGIFIAVSLSIIAVWMLSRYDPDAMLVSMQKNDGNMLLYRDTPFGKLMVSEEFGQLNFYNNGKPSFSSDDLIEKEEKVHFAMSLHPAPKNVLMLEGGLDGSAWEVMKYSVESIDYVDPDIWSLEAAEEYTGLSWPGSVNIIHTDPRNFLLKTRKTYDVILLNTSFPENIGSNRFYTREFFRRLKKRLNKGGLVSLRMGGTENYYKNDALHLQSSMYNTLEQSFTYIRLIPGESLYYIVSDEAITGNVCSSIKENEIPTAYVNAYYLNDKILSDKAEKIQLALLPHVEANTDQKPVVPYLSIIRWLGVFNIPFWIITLIPALIIVLFVFLLKPVNLGLFTTGFTASAAELLLLFSFQAYYGFLYQMAGIIIMLFMAGLALGAGYLHMYIKENKRSFSRIQMIIGLLIALTPIMLIFSTQIPVLWFHGAVVGIITFAVGCITGLQFRLGTLLQDARVKIVAGNAYGADLAGSAFGVFFTAIVFYPILGLYSTGMLLAFFNFLTVWKFRRQ